MTAQYGHVVDSTGPQQNARGKGCTLFYQNCCFDIYTMLFLCLPGKHLFVLPMFMWVHTCTNDTRMEEVFFSLQKWVKSCPSLLFHCIQTSLWLKMYIWLIDYVALTVWCYLTIDCTIFLNIQMEFHPMQDPNRDWVKYCNDNGIKIMVRQNTALISGINSWEKGAQKPPSHQPIVFCYSKDLFNSFILYYASAFQHMCCDLAGSVRSQQYRFWDIARRNEFLFVFYCSENLQLLITL